VAIAELDGKLDFAASLPPNTLSVEDIQLDLERLTTKAAAKIREYMLGKIFATRKPMSNPQLQQNALLKYVYRMRACRVHMCRVSLAF